MPKLPERATETKTEDTDLPGQVLTYTCDEGFEFAEAAQAVSITAPTSTTTTTTTTSTTTTPLTWDTFKGAEYSRVSVDFDVTWSEARDRCVAEGAKLASIPSYEVQYFLNQQVGENFDRWIGASDSSTEGTFVWEDGVTFEYTNWATCTLTDNDASKNCVKIQHAEEGKWAVEDCNAAGVRDFICMKGTSTVSLWNTIHGAEYAYIRHPTCITTWNRAKTMCENGGGSIASVLHQDVIDGVHALYGAAIHRDYWIGLNDIDNEGTLVWDKGETYNWATWEDNTNDGNKDCVRSRWEDGKMSFNSCNGNVKAVLCMKGTSDVAATTTQSSPTSSSSCSISNVADKKKYNNNQSKCGIAGGSKKGTTMTIEECCTACDGIYGMNAISWKRTGSKDECLCQNKDASNCERGSDNDFKTADCSCAKKRKRSIMGNDTLASDSPTLGNISAPKRLLTRHKRSIDTTKERIFTCESLWSGTAGYWNYDYTTPEYCYRKYTYSAYFVLIFNLCRGQLHSG